MPAKERREWRRPTGDTRAWDESARATPATSGKAVTPQRREIGFRKNLWLTDNTQSRYPPS